MADGLKTLYVKALAVDRRGDLWVGTLGGGLSQLHDGAITTLTSAQGLLHDEVFEVLPDEADSAELQEALSNQRFPFRWPSDVARLDMSGLSVSSSPDT